MVVAARLTYERKLEKQRQEMEEIRQRSSKLQLLLEEHGIPVPENDYCFPTERNASVISETKD